MNGWSAYWLGWFLTAVAAFLGPEIYCLVTGNGHTLSATIWNLESLQRGQPVWQWTAVHWLLGGAFAVLLIWLLFHFTFGIWR